MGSGASRNQHKQDIPVAAATEVGATSALSSSLLENSNSRSPRRSSPSRRSDGEYSPNSQHSPVSDRSSPTEREEAALRAHFAQSAMSLGMDNDDLIFNLLYFSDANTTFQSMFNSAVEETVAAHSAGNTPYKLQPATQKALDKLNVLQVTGDTILEEKECAICQEDMELGTEIVFMPDCKHCFHDECVKRWFTLQSWCPVCRTQIISPEEDIASEADECTDSRLHEKRNLGRCFDEAYDDIENHDADEEGVGREGDCGEEDEEEEKQEWESPSRENDGPPEISLDNPRSRVARHTVERLLGDAVRMG